MTAVLWLSLSKGDERRSYGLKSLTRPFEGRGGVNYGGAGPGIPSGTNSRFFCLNAEARKSKTPSTVRFVCLIISLCPRGTPPAASGKQKNTCPPNYIKNTAAKPCTSVEQKPPHPCICPSTRFTEYIRTIINYFKRGKTNCQGQKRGGRHWVAPELLLPCASVRVVRAAYLIAALRPRSFIKISPLTWRGVQWDLWKAPSLIQS